MATELPEPLQWVLLLLSGTRWPEADEDNLRSMAEHWRTMAGTLKDVEESADAAVRRALVGQVGVAATGLSQYWDKFTVGQGESQPGALPGLAKACEGMADMLESMANSAETAKIQIIAQLGILAVEIATAEVEAPFTAGLSLAQIPVMVGISRTAVQQILKKLAVEAMKFAAKQAVQMAAINLLAQSIQVLEGHRKGLDLKELGDNAVGGAVAGASGNLLGKGIGAAGSKLGLGKVMGTVPGKMVTAGAAGVGADVITQAATTGTVDSHSLLGSGLSGASAAGLHAAGAAVNGHFRTPAEVPHGAVPGGAGAEVPAGAHVPEHAPAPGPGESAGAERPAGTDGSRSLPAASQHVAGADSPAAGAHGAPAGAPHEGVPAGGQHPAAEPAGGGAHPTQHPAADGAGTAQSQPHPAAAPSEHGAAGGGSPVQGAGHGGEGGTPGPVGHGGQGGTPGHAEASPAPGGGPHPPVTETAAPTAAGSHASVSEGTPAQHVGPASTHEPAHGAATLPHEGAATPAAGHAPSLPPLHEGGAAGVPTTAAHETPLPAAGGHHGADVPQLHVAPEVAAGPVHPVGEGPLTMRHVPEVPQLHVAPEVAAGPVHPVGEGPLSMRHVPEVPELHLASGAAAGPVQPVHPVGEGSLSMRHAPEVPELHLSHTDAAAAHTSPEALVRPFGSGADEIRLAAGPADGVSSGAGRPVSGPSDVHGTPFLHSSATAPVAGSPAPAAVHPTAQPGRPPVPAEFRTGPVRPEGAPHLPGVRTEPVPGRGEAARPARSLHEHPAGMTALAFPLQSSAGQKALYKMHTLLRPTAVPEGIRNMMYSLTHPSPGGTYLHPETTTRVPVEAIHFNKRTNTLKTRLDPTTLNDLAPLAFNGIKDLAADPVARRAPEKMLAKTQERVEAMARMDYRTADYWEAQDARRDRLDDMVVANTLRRPPGLPAEALARVDSVLREAPDAITAAGRILQDHPGIVLGEKHGEPQSFDFLKNNMAALREAGVRTVYLEALRGDSFQSHLDAHLRAPANADMPPLLEAMVSRYERSHGEGLRATIESAKAEGVGVRAVDGHPARREGDGPWTLYDRAARFNTYVADAVGLGQAGSDGKFVLLVGRAHVGPHDAPTMPDPDNPDGVVPRTPEHRIHLDLPAPGLSQLLDAPGLEVKNTDEGRHSLHRV
ncbi:hypothetical protein [Kitasatospora sp. A2-31]|uniref:WXG100-like domain-containing protein n=1 Tax=Kitasatospora sp. A2-31 TaxID=2916414 RepID=UPI001EE78D4F|nr:hypothetical protein [Kitasatospora sp. A2-31]MCG6493141.1 hypothetical protein [Kitasatospora sp. A2-31]